MGATLGTALLYVVAAILHVRTRTWVIAVLWGLFGYYVITDHNTFQSVLGAIVVVLGGAHDVLAKRS